MTVSTNDLRNAGLRVTLPRLKILHLLENSEPHHLSAEDVYKKLLGEEENIGLATVYRVLTQLEAAGIVRRHNFDSTWGHAIFELIRDEHHDHMVDVDSGQVIEFVNEEIEELQREVAREHGFEIVNHDLVLYVRKKGGKSVPGVPSS